jgi:hypothetical protein
MKKNEREMHGCPSKRPAKPYTFSVFVAIYESSYNIVDMRPNILKFGKCNNFDVLFHVTVFFAVRLNQFNIRSLI